MIAPFATYFSWYVPAHVAYIELPSIIDYDYLVDANNALVDCMTRLPSKHKIHLITDARCVVEFPTDMLKLRKVSHAFNHERMGWALIVSKSPLVRFLGATVPQIMLKRRTRAFNDPHAAIEFLQHNTLDFTWESANNRLLQSVSC